jgi:lipopolysaccharide export system protein LptA
VRLTIERIRTLVLVAGALLLVTLGVFLVRAKWKNLLNRHDLPQKLAKGIVFESDGFTVVHALGAHSQYRIHASREVELKTNFVELHDVQIDLYGEDGKQIDKISGDIFEYDLKTGKATAQGPVEMLLTRPSASTEAAVEQADKTEGDKTKGDKKREEKIKSHVIADADATGGAGQIDVKTSGVTFDRNSGLVTTDQRVNFSAAQGNGSAIGASYNSQSGYLTLEQAVELTTHRGGDEVKIQAQHAELDRGAQTCEMEKASAVFHGGQADTAEAKIMFREDGSAERLDATGGFTLATTKGGHVAAPVAWMEFDEHSEPLHGHMEGGVTMDSVSDSANRERRVHGTAPTAELNFAAKGELKSAHLERGVEMTSEETSAENAGQDAGKGGLRVSRKWRSPVLDIGFRPGQGSGQHVEQHAGRGGIGEGQLEVETMRGSGGVTITSESQRGNAPATPSRMSADEVTGSFGEGSALRTLSGVGHAEIDETTATGARQTANGDRLEASFAENREQGTKGTREQETSSVSAGATEVQSAELDGNVVLFEQPAQKAGGQAQPPLRATAGKAVYEGQGEWLHLTMSPRVVNGGMDLTAEKMDVSQQSGDAFAHGDVKATWTGAAAGGKANNDGARGGTRSDGAGKNDAGDKTSGGGVTLGGKGPAHVVAAEAQLNQSSGEATFHGHARLWQQTNFVSGPVIVLNQHLQTLVATSSDPAEPVRVVMLSAGGTDTGRGANGNGAAQSAGQAGASNAGGQPATPSVIRVRGGELRYSDAERRAVMHGGTLGAVVAETGTATSSSDAVELLLMPAGNHDASGAPALNGQAQGGQAQVDQMKATGHVVLTSQGRRGTGEQLVYTGATGEYVLTGSAGAPPKMSDPEHGTVTGEALIFDSRDDRVRIEGGGRETETDTTAPDAHGK